MVETGPSEVDMSKYITYEGKTCENFKNPIREKLFEESITDKQAWFDKLAQDVHWHKKYTQIIDESDKYLTRWFPDGEINLAYNCLDRHVLAGDGDRVCFHQYSAYTQTEKDWTYKEVMEQSGRLASILKKQFGIQTGDRVVIYMPMVIEAAFAMLACARIGATHSVVFGGFAPKELASRIDDSTPKLVITASAGIEPGKKIPYAPIVDEALNTHATSDGASKLPRLIVQRHELDGTLLAKDLDESVYHDYAKLMEAETEVCEVVPVPSNHPLYILYTSGTTGAPKGVVRDHGGTCVAVQWAIRNVFNCGKGDTFQAMSDIGWVVGHTNIVYGPLLTCSRSVFFEGKPITPNPGIVWELCAKYKTKVLYMAPTGLRVIKKMDYDGEYVQKFDLSALETFHVVGERCDPDTIKWSHRHLKDTMLNDTWWQTETGWPMAGNMFNIEEFGKIYPTLPGSVSRPIPGYDLKVFDEANQEVPAGTLGKIVIKMPMPPSFMLTLWGNDEAFVNKYLAETPGYYTTGDAGIVDEQGYVHIMTRVDDVINTAGHRISTGRLEEVLNEEENVVESAVVGYNDPLRGECALAFVVLRGKGVEEKTEEEITAIKNSCQHKIRTDVGAFCRLFGVVIMNRLPKTRSGKIVRGTIRKIVNKQDFVIPATIEDAAALDEIKEEFEKFFATLKQ